MAANPFDQFDEPVAASSDSANPFDKFDPPRHGALGEIGSQFWNMGVKVELPRMIGQAAQYPFEPGNPIREWGKSLEEAATAREAAHPEWAPEPEKHNIVTNDLAGGAAMLPQSVLPAAAVGGALAALPFELPAIAGIGIAGAAGAIPTGLSQAQQTYAKAKAEGVPEEQAVKAARLTGIEEWGGETIGNVIAGRLLGFGKGAAKTAAGALQEATAPGVVKPFVKQLPETFVGEVGTEMGQAAAEAATERAYGIDPNQPSPWEQAKQVIGPTLGMSTLLTLFGLAGHALNARSAQHRAAALSSPDTHPDARTQIAQSVAKSIAQTDPQAADVFSRNVGEDIAAGRPVNLDESLFAPRAAPRQAPATPAGSAPAGQPPGPAPSAFVQAGVWPNPYLRQGVAGSDILPPETQALLSREVSGTPLPLYQGPLGGRASNAEQIAPQRRYLGPAFGQPSSAAPSPFGLQRRPAPQWGMLPPAPEQRRPIDLLAPQGLQPGAPAPQFGRAAPAQPQGAIPVPGLSLLGAGLSPMGQAAPSAASDLLAGQPRPALPQQPLPQHAALAATRPQAPSPAIPVSQPSVTPSPSNIDGQMLPGGPPQAAHAQPQSQPSAPAHEGMPPLRAPLRPTPTAEPSPVLPAAAQPLESSPAPSVGKAQFKPSRDWQEIPEGIAVPPGGEFRLDSAQGKTFGRWPQAPSSAQAEKHETAASAPTPSAETAQAEKAAPETAQGAQKEPWEMTRTQYKAEAAEWYRSHKTGRYPQSMPAEEAIRRGRDVGIDMDLMSPAMMNGGFDHKVLVAEAIRDGKPVPAEVLKDYPDLAAKFGTTAQEVPHAAIQGQKPEGHQPEHLGAAPGAAVPAHGQEVRQEEGGQAGGRRGHEGGRQEPQEVGPAAQPPKESLPRKLKTLAIGDTIIDKKGKRYPVTAINDEIVQVKGQAGSLVFKRDSLQGWVKDVQRGETKPAVPETKAPKAETKPAQPETKAKPEQKPAEAEKPSWVPAVGDKVQSAFPVEGVDEPMLIKGTLVKRFGQLDVKGDNGATYTFRPTQSKTPRVGAWSRIESTQAQAAKPEQKPAEAAAAGSKKEVEQYLAKQGQSYQGFRDWLHGQGWGGNLWTGPSDADASMDLAKKYVENMRAEEQPATEPDLGAMFDEVLAEETGQPAKPKAPSQPRPERTAGEAAKSAAQNTAQGLNEALDGLAALFGGKGRLSSGMTFDEETYAKAKPLFQQAIAHFKEAADDIREAMRLVVRALLARFKDPAMVANMKPYVVRFIEDVQSGKVQTTEEPEHGQVPANLPAGHAGEGAANVPGTEGERQAATGGEPSRGERAGAGGEGAARRPGASQGEGLPEHGPGAQPSKAAGRGDRHRADDRVPRGAAPQNYRITEADHLGEGGAKTKARQNIEAIRLVKQLEQQNRPATPEEQAKLVKYVGWGASELANGMFPVREGEYKEGWEQLGKELKALLTPEEYQAAGRSTQYAHYTSAEVIRGIYDGIERMGFHGGVMLEPGMGIGHFAGLMPNKMAARTHYTGIEFDPITAAIAKALYPKHNIKAEDYTKTRQPDNFYDAAIGNPPFGDITILSDPRYAKNRFNLHDYFFAKTLDAVRPGGLVVFITSRYTMDKGNDAARQYIAGKADLLGAIRLPQTAFKQNAGTQVVTDILFLKRRAPDAAPAGEAWDSLATVKTPEGDTKINRYYAEHPDMVIGQHSLTGSMYGKNEYTVTAPEGAIGERLAQAIKALPETVYESGKSVEESLAETAKVDFSPENKKDQGYYLKDGVLMQNQAGVGRVVAIKEGGRGEGLYPAQAAVIRQLIPIREAAKAVLQAQLTDGDWKGAQAKLNRLYDAFVKHNGIINHTVIRTREDERTGKTITTRTRKNFPRAFQADPDAFTVLALEDYDEAENTARKSPIFSERVIRPQAIPKIDSAVDALPVTLNELGRVDMQAIADKAGVSVKDAAEQLGDLVFRNPKSDAWETADEYLSGNVREKLKEAEAAVARNPEMKRNVDALKAIQPKDLPPSAIDVRLGAPWVPAGDVARFADEVLGIRAQVLFEPQTFTWGMRSNNIPTDPVKAQKFSTPDKSASDLLNDALNQRMPKIYTIWRDDTGEHRELNTTATEAAQSRLQEVKEAYSRWIWQDGDRATRLARVYNDKYNNTVTRRFDGAHITLPGMSAVFSLHPHQKRVVWRIAQSGNTYMAHAVGAGKTMASVAAGMEMKRLGLINKPMYVVPGHMLQQFAREFVQAYPAAKILVADEENFSGGKRKRFIGRIAADNWDGIVITHSAFGFIPVSPELNDKILKEQIAEYRNALADLDPKIDRIMRKRIEKLIERFQERLVGARSTRQDRGLSFEETGIDQLFVDESHEFRKLSFATNQGSIKGIDPEGSQRAFDLYTKVRHLDSVRPGRGVVLMSGTPVTNTLGELFTLQRFLSERRMKDLGVDNFDGWSAMFGDTVTNLEQTPSGGYQQVTRFARFTNLPELVTMFRDFADVVSPDDLAGIVQLPAVRGGKMQVVSAERSDIMRDYQKDLEARINAIKKRKRPPQKGDDILLAVINDGRHAAIDPRYIDASLPSDPASKLNMMLRDIYATWKESSDWQYQDRDGRPEPIRGATQMVFADLGVSANRGFSAYQWMKQALVQMGVPANQIAFMQDYKKSEEKLRLFGDMNAGRKRILIGSTKAMGTGVNAQQRLYAMSHLDAPWYPADVVQRRGRMIRQGNKNKEVIERAYVTKGTYDATMWQMNETKQRFIDQIMSGDTSIRSMEDLDGEANQFAVAKAIASGDERLMKLAGLQGDVMRLERLRNAHQDEQVSLRSNISWANGTIAGAEEKIANAEADIAKRIDTAGDRFAATVGGKHIETRKDAGEAILAAVTQAEADPKFDTAGGKRVIGKLAGFDIVAQISARQISPQDPSKFLDRRTYNTSISLNTKSWQSDIDMGGPESRAGISALGLIAKLEGQAKGLEDRIAGFRADIAEAQNKLRGYRSALGQPFQKEAEYQDNLAEMRRLEAELQASTKAEEATAQQGEKADVSNLNLAEDLPVQAEQLRAQARKEGFRDLQEMLDQAPEKFLAAAQQWRREHPDTDTGDVSYQKAWHGSPHTFDKFTTQKIGSGEGAQAYGWGMYFASNKSVAEYYRSQLGTITINGMTPVQYLMDRESRGQFSASTASAVDYLRAYNGDFNAARNDVGTSARTRQELDRIEREEKIGTNGRLYQVDLAPAEVDYLDWDKPLSARAIKAIGQDAMRRMDLDDRVTLEKHFQVEQHGHDYVVVGGNNEYSRFRSQDRAEQERQRLIEAHLPNGNLLYVRLTQEKGSPEAASRYLFSIGIPGIRYADQASRGKEGGSHNYVLFDDSLVNIEAAFHQLQGKAQPERAEAAIGNRQHFRAIGAQVLSGASADDIYAGILRNAAKNPLEAALVAAFKRMGMRPKIELVDALENRSGQLDDSIAGQYRQSSDTVSINQTYGPGVAGLTAMHELLHAGTVRQLRDHPELPAVKAMHDLYHEVVDKLTPEQRAQFRRETENVREFVTYGLGYDAGSSAFRGMLKNLEVTPRAGGIKTAWQAFIDLVRRILGVDPKHTTALGELIELTARIMEAGRGERTAAEDISHLEIPGLANIPLQRAVREHISDIFRTDSKVNWLNKTINTPYHLAQKFPRWYKPVFDKGQDFLSEATSLSMRSESQAPDLFRSMQSWQQATTTGKAKSADIDAAMKAVIAGTLDDELTYSAQELRNRFHLTPEQVKLYQQARKAADTSLDQMAMAHIGKLARNLKVSAEQVQAARDAATLPDYVKSLYDDALKPIREQAKDDLQAAEDALAGVNKKADPDTYAALERRVEKAKREKALVDDTISDIFRVRHRTEQLKSEGYFPLMRFGRYTLHIADDEGKSLYFGMYETRYARNRAERALRQDDQFQGAHFKTGEMNEEAYQMFQGVSLDAMQAFAEQVGMDEDPIVQEYLRLAVNNRSAMKRMIHRQGVEGFSQDMRRVLASFIISNARYAARQYHMGDMANAVRAIPKELGDLQKQAQHLYDYVNHPVEEFARLRGFLFFNYLGGSVAAALTNLTQVPLVASPYFAQYGAGAVKSLLKWTNPLRKPTGAMAAALKRAEDEGVVSPQEIYNLTATARGGISPIRTRAVQTGLYLWGSLFAAAEQFNRSTTFKAAYEVAEKRGERDPYAFAVKAVEETQFIYNKGNRPALGRGLGAPLLTFKQFSISYIEFLKRLPTKQRMLALALLTMAAGLEGLPFAGDFEDLLDTLAQWIPGFDKVLPMNSKKALREWAGQYLGQTGRDILLSGASGIPGFPIDIQRRLGAENLIPGTAIFKQSETDKTRDIREMFGAGAGVLQQAVYGAASIAKGNVGKAASDVMPKAVRDILKGIDMATTGEYRDDNGKLITDTTGTQAGFKMLGFQPGNVADVQATRQIEQQDINLHNVKEAGIADKLAQAILEKRPELRVEAIKDVREWNAAHPDMRITINPQQIRSRVRNARMTAQQRFLKQTPREMRGQVRQGFLG